MRRAMFAPFTEKCLFIIIQLLHISLRWKHINPEVNVIAAGGNPGKLLTKLAAIVSDENV